MEIILYTSLFLLEIAALIAFSYWGFHVDKGIFIKVLLGISTPILIAFVWGLFLAPKATYPITETPYERYFKSEYSA
ncbi:YrdB family protein [Oceanobacillus sp. CF4.6]|uniref:YrdB family protein n=1 Tax=Oceanobacillus sp. CF4.6 TaxID=3373080 RepID=UPI003EE53A93